jgi:hypothetical protein
MASIGTHARTAFTEAFGGWGIIGQLEDMEGIEIMEPR